MVEICLMPAPGCMVRDPVTRAFLSAEGEIKELNSYWKRRIRMKDVVVAPTVVEKRESPPKKYKTKKDEE